MEGCQVRFLLLLFFIFLCGISAYGKTVSPYFLEFPEQTFSRHVKYSRHQPFCAVIRKSEGTGSGLERTVYRLWRGDNNDNFTDWEFGAISSHKLENQDSLPTSLPALRCYLGQTSLYDYHGNRSRENIQNWLRQMTMQYVENSQDVTMETVNQALKYYNIVLLSFPSGPRHTDVEDMVYKLASEFKSCRALPVHYYSSDIKDLKKKYGVEHEPAVVIIHSKGGEGGVEEVRVYESPLVMYKVLHLYLIVKQMSVPVLSQKTFEVNFVRQETVEWQFVPILVCYYAYWAKDVDAHLEAFQLSMLKFNRRGARVKLAFIDLQDMDAQSVTNRFLGTNFMKSVPFTVLYDRDENKKMSKYLISKERPYPWQLYQDLNEKQLTELLNLREILPPWGNTPPTQVTLTTEGPHGRLCTPWSHNTTDNTPVTSSHLGKSKRKRATPSKKWDIHNVFATETVDKGLKTLEGIPLITKSIWSEVIEKSHAPNHLYYKSGKWAGEITKVALVVFIMADCGSCKNNMETFKQIQKSVSFVDGGVMYFVNCTAEPELCKTHNIKGYPTITAFRGHGWVGTSACLTEKSQKIFPNFVRLDYHGVIQTTPVMDWFGDAAADAVTDMKLQKLGTHFQDKDVRIVAYLKPRTSRFLKRLIKGVHHFKYECVRLVCERLYGVIDCFTVYSPNIPAREFNNEDLDMVVSDVLLERRDGVKATVMRVGQSLMDTVDEQADSSLHQFHTPHRYNLNPRQKCETNHAICTDFLTDFVLDHSRMPVTPISSAMFHTTRSLLKEEDLPIMIILAEPEQVREGLQLMQDLTAVAYYFYKELMVMTLDVTQYTSWASSFVPADYRRLRILDMDDPDPYGMFSYPRICIIQKHDHHSAAFYPPIQSKKDVVRDFSQDSIIEFVLKFLDDPHSVRTPTEHF